MALPLIISFNSQALADISYSEEVPIQTCTPNLFAQNLGCNNGNIKVRLNCGGFVDYHEQPCFPSTINWTINNSTQSYGIVKGNEESCAIILEFPDCQGGSVTATLCSIWNAPEWARCRTITVNY